LIKVRRVVETLDWLVAFGFLRFRLIILETEVHVVVFGLATDPESPRLEAWEKYTDKFTE